MTGLLMDLADCAPHQVGVRTEKDGDEFLSKMAVMMAECN